MGLGEASPLMMASLVGKRDKRTWRPGPGGRIGCVRGGRRSRRAVEGVTSRVPSCFRRHGRTPAAEGFTSRGPTTLRRERQRRTGGKDALKQPCASRRVDGAGPRASSRAPAGNKVGLQSLQALCGAVHKELEAGGSIQAAAVKLFCRTPVSVGEEKRQPKELLPAPFRTVPSLRDVLGFRLRCARRYRRARRAHAVAYGTTALANLMINSLNVMGAAGAHSFSGHATGGVPAGPQQSGTRMRRDAAALLSYADELAADFVEGEDCAAEAAQVTKFLSSKSPVVSGYDDERTLTMAEGLRRDLVDFPRDRPVVAKQVVEHCEPDLAAWLKSAPLKDALPLAARKHVWSGSADWEALMLQAATSGLSVPVRESEVLRDREGTAVLAGAFAVPKTGKDGSVRQRFILDVGSNGFIVPPPVADLGLPYPSMQTLIVLNTDQELEFYGDDDSNCFYAWALAGDSNGPREDVLPWATKFALGKKVPLSLFKGHATLPEGADLSEMVYPGLIVAPMGWKWSVHLIQKFQRVVAARAGLDMTREVRSDRPFPLVSPHEPVFQFYIDNFDETHLVSRNDPQASGPSANQSKLRDLKMLLGIPQNSHKAVEGNREVETLGIKVDGRVGRAAVNASRRRVIFRLGVALLAQNVVSRKHLRVYLGKYVHAAMMRRAAMAVFGDIFYASHFVTPRAGVRSRGARSAFWDFEKALEVYVSLGLLPMLVCNLRAPFSSQIYCSDSSLGGGAVMKAEIGIEESLDLMQAVDYRGAAINLTRAPADFLAEVLTKKGVPQLSFNPRGLEWKCAFAWEWKAQEHITLLETRATHALHKHVARGSRSLRYFVLPDNQPSMGALAKGRSSSRRLNAILRRVGALLLAADLYPYYAWTASHLQPADADSRRVEL